MQPQTQQSQQQQQQQAEQKRQQEIAEQKRLILKQVLTPEAQMRLANVALVKPETATQIENYLIQVAQQGQLAGQVTEDQLKDLLEKFSEATHKTTKVTISRRRMDFDDDDDYF